MELRYMGFEQQKSIRTYRFDGVKQSARVGRYVISADLDMFLRHGVAIQEGPALSAMKLASNMDRLHLQPQQLTDDDFNAFLAARKAAAAADKPRKYARRAA